MIIIKKYVHVINLKPCQSIFLDILLTNFSKVINLRFSIKVQDL